MPELSLGEVFSLLQTQITSLGDTLGQRMDKLEAQNSREHAAVRTELQELGSDVRQVTAMAASSKSLSDANAHELAEHKTWHRDREQFAAGVQQEENRIEEQQKRLKDTALDIIKDSLKYAAIAGVGIALGLLKGHLL